MSYTPLNNTILSGDPNAPTPTAGDNDTSVATTAFVQTELGDYLPLAGGSMTGDITLGSGVDINFNDTSSGLQWSDVRVSRVAANVIQLDAGDFLRVQETPVNNFDVTNKSYVDTLFASSIHYHEAVDLATTGTNITLSGEQTIDGVLTSGSRVLVKDQSTTSQNGIYITAAGAWTRATDFDEATEITGGDAVFVLDGTVNLHTVWTQTEDVNTVGTDPILWVQTSAAGVVSNMSDLGDADTAGAVDGAILRYEAGASEWQDTTALLFSDANQLQILSDASTGGLVMGAGSDVNLYRSAADVLKTDDDLHAGSTFQVDVSAGLVSILADGATGGLVMGAGSDVNLYRSAADVLKTDDDLHAGSTFQVDVSAGLVSILADGATGGLVMGAGSDVNLYRSAANVLKTDDAMTVAGKLTHEAGLNVEAATKTADYSVNLATDYVILADNSGDTADLIITLPAVHALGDAIHVKDAGGNAASGTNQILISPDAGDSIDGGGAGVDFELTVDYQSVYLISNGTNWFLI